MELISIEIESYKSIKTPVTISFFDGLPTVLIVEQFFEFQNIKYTFLWIDVSIPKFLNNARH